MGKEADGVDYGSLKIALLGVVKIYSMRNRLAKRLGSGRLLARGKIKHFLDLSVPCMIAIMILIKISLCGVRLSKINFSFI